MEEDKTYEGQLFLILRGPTWAKDEIGTPRTFTTFAAAREVAEKLAERNEGVKIKVFAELVEYHHQVIHPPTPAPRRVLSIVSRMSHQK